MEKWWIVREEQLEGLSRQNADGAGPRVIVAVMELVQGSTYNMEGINNNRWKNNMIVMYEYHA